MQCPKCASEAADFQTSEGVVVNFCPGCLGLWFDQGELALYCETAEDLPHLDALMPQARPTTYACPRCQTSQLVELPYFPEDALLVDWCPGCHGAWLDAKEVIKIEDLAARRENHTVRLRRGVQQLVDAGYTPFFARTA